MDRPETPPRPPERPRAVRSSDAAALVALVALVVTLFSDVVLRGRVLWERDIHRYWLQQAEAFVRSLAAGSWPLWNPWISFGEPLLANPTAQVLYPPTWLLVVLPADRYYSVAVVAHALLAAAGAFALVRGLGGSRGAALVAGGIWVASGPYLSLANMLNQAAGAAWLPWAVLAGHVASTRGTPSSALAFGAALAAPLLAGSPETVVAAIAAVALLAVASGRPSRAGALAALAGVGLGAALSAAQWLPTLELAGVSARGALERHVRVAHSMPVAGLVQVAWPWFPRGQPLPEAQGELSAPFLYSLHVGLVPLLLAAAAVATTGITRRRALALLGLAVLATVVALGPATFVYDAVLAAAPPLALLRYPVKAMVLVALLVALLAGLGFDALAARVGRWSPALAVVALAGVVQLVAVHRDLNATTSTALLRHRPEVLGAVTQPAHSRLFTRDREAATPAEVAGWQRRIAELGARPDLAVAVDLRSGLVAPVAGEWGRFVSFEPDINGVQTRWVARLFDVLRATRGRPEEVRLLQIGAVGQVVIRGRAVVPGLAPVAAFESLLGDPLVVHDVPGHVPRAYAVGAATVAEGDAALRRLLDPAFDPHAEVVLASGPGRRAPSGFAGAVSITSLRPDEVVLAADMSHPGWVVLVDAFAPGWQASVDGRTAEVLRANEAFRAVAVPAGRHTLRVAYRPASVVAGATVSGGTLLAGLVLLARRPRGPGGDAESKVRST